MGVSYGRYMPSIRKHAKPEIDNFFNGNGKIQIIIFDVETNGLSGEYSVLSCSAIKYEVDSTTCEASEIARFDRYYFPVERFRKSATDINGLTRKVITERRKGVTYPKHFADDGDFDMFCSGVDRFVAHNISFDLQFVSPPKNKKRFCTMTTNTDIVAVEFLNWKNEWKWPKLSETAKHYEIPFNANDLHGSMYDTEITATIFFKMLKMAVFNTEISPLNTQDKPLPPILKDINVDMTPQNKYRLPTPALVFLCFFGIIVFFGFVKYIISESNYNEPNKHDLVNKISIEKKSTLDKKNTVESNKEEVETLTNNGKVIKEKYPQASNRICNAIGQSKLIEGITPEQTIDAMHSEPDTIVYSMSSNGILYEQWMYADKRLFFKKGVLISWQE